MTFHVEQDVVLHDVDVEMHNDIDINIRDDKSDYNVKCDIVVETDNVARADSVLFTNHGSPSTSLHLHASLSDTRKGFQYLEDILLRNFNCGFVASPFNQDIKADINKLTHLLSLHGISPQGLSIEGRRVAFFRHVFSGHCVSETRSSLDYPACSFISKDFKSAKEMSFAAFNIISSADPIQRSDEDLLCVLRDLDIFTGFRPQKLRHQIAQELKRQAEIFLLFQAVLTNGFAGFERT